MRRDLGLLLLGLTAVVGCDRPAPAPAGGAAPAAPAVSTVRPQKRGMTRMVEQPGAVQPSGNIVGVSVVADVRPSHRAGQAADLFGQAPDRIALPRAFLACMRALADRSSVLVAIDDAQWLDPPSQRILAFVARRLGDAPVGILATQRGGGDGPFPGDLRRYGNEGSRPG